ncbi:unannotated protein [freshwater metagenome]|uniref:Unannotated protein n=1 Tax=freshwater metagenome TaxID=449393 RepID=A0A6J6RJQ5_9ZZZZ
MQVGDGRAGAHRPRRHLEGVGQRRGRAEAQAGCDPTVATHPDDVAHVVHRVRRPVPHVERVHPVVGVRGAVEVDVPGVVGELLLVLLTDDRRIGRLGEDLLVEIDVRRVVQLVEALVERVVEDHRSSAPHHRVVAVGVEVVAQPHAGREDRVHRAVDVVGPEVGHPHHQHVGVAVDLHELLAVHLLQRALVDGLDLAGVDAGQAVGRPQVVEELVPQPVGSQRQTTSHRQHRGLVAHRPLPLALHQEVVGLGEDVVVEGGLDLEDLDVLLDHPPDPPRRVVHRRLLVVHERPGGHHRGGVVVVAQRAVRRQPDADRLVAAVHRDEVDVHVDEQVGLGGPLADLDVLALVGRAQVGEVVAVLGVEVVELALRVEGAEDPLPHDVLQLRGGHPPVQRVGRDDLDVVDAGRRGQGQHLLDDPLADVGSAHRRQRQRQVVEGDREPHPGEEQLRQRVGVRRVQQRVEDRALDVGDRGQRLRRVDHPGAEGEGLEPEAESLVDDQGRGPVVDLEDESGTTHAVHLIGSSWGRRPP